MVDIPASCRRALSFVALVLAVGLAPPGAAQDSVSRPVVQPLPPPEAAQLSAALQQLGKNPRDLDALIAAGIASLKLDDVDAALGFFSRADAVSPGNAQARAGVAAALVKDENPFDALRLFDEAERGGASLDQLVGERALAYDLVGDNVRAQQLYRAQLARGEDAEASRRLAVSLAITGDEAGMERVLLPMLQRRDLAAYRARAFSLAILGKVDEAMTIADAVMPASSAARIAPYLQYMPRLTRAQQAAAANLGNFPRTVDIGRDDPRIAQYRGAPSTVPDTRGADSRLVPAGAPLGPTPGDGRRRPDRPADEGEEVALARVDAVASPPVAAPPPPVAEPAQLEPEPEPAATASPPVQALAEAESGSAFDLGAIPGSRTAAVETATDAAPLEPAPAPADVATAFADFQIVLSPAQRAAGAVDLARIEPPRERPAPKPETKPTPPKNPSRVWVQLATGRDRAALGFDWRRMLRDSKGVLADQKGYLARWGETNRLLTGPFETPRAAQGFVARLNQAGIKSFTFTSDEGEEVTPLAAR